MSINLKIEGIIFNSIYSKIKNYIPYSRSLYTMRSLMRVILYDSNVFKNNIFLEVGYKSCMIYINKKDIDNKYLH